jgi:G3E family GTPase
MIPMSLVTGFLGSGKTTFLKYIMQHERERKLVYLVNEFSPIDVDGQLLKTGGRDVVALPGGSVFCRCLVTEFIGALTDIALKFHSEDAPVEGVVIEASGMANPMVIEQMLTETQLDQQYALATIVSVVDPGTLPHLLQSLPNIRAQLEASDVAIINKTDRYEEAALAEAEAKVREIRTGIELVRASFGQADVELFRPGASRGVRGEYAGCADPNYARFHVRLKGAVPLEELRALIRAAGEDLYRLKGFVRSEGELLYVDYAAGDLQTQRAEQQHLPADVVFITNGAAQEKGQALAEALKQAAG